MISSSLATATDLSKQERAAAAFILHNPGFVEDHTARELAAAAGVSAATITRLCKRVGLSGFNQFKVEFVAEWKASNGNLYARLSEPLIDSPGKEAPVDEQVEMMSRFYNRVVYEMARLIEPEEFDRLCREVAACRRVDLFGTGLNLGACEQAAFKLQTLGIEAHAQTAINVQALKRGSLAGKRVAILTSHTGGANGAMLEAANGLKAAGVLVVALTPDRSSPLGRRADLCIRTFRTETVDRLSLLAYPISVSYVFDLLYATLLAQEIDAMFPQTAREYYAS